MPKRAHKPNLEAIEPLLLRPTEIARILNCSVRHVYNLMDLKLIDRRQWYRRARYQRLRSRSWPVSACLRKSPAKAANSKRLEYVERSCREPRGRKAKLCLKAQHRHHQINRSHTYVPNFAQAVPFRPFCGSHPSHRVTSNLLKGLVRDAFYFYPYIDLAGLILRVEGFTSAQQFEAAVDLMTEQHERACALQHTNQNPDLSDCDLRDQRDRLACEKGDPRQQGRPPNSKPATD